MKEKVYVLMPQEELSPLNNQQAATEIEKKLDQIVERLDKLEHGNGLHQGLWKIDDLKKYLSRSSSRVYDLIKKEDFPAPIRLPSGKHDQGHPLWDPKDIKRWATGYKY